MCTSFGGGGSGGSKGGTLGAPPPPRTKIFLISCSFLGKSGKCVCWGPLLQRILDPPPGGPKMKPNQKKIKCKPVIGSPFTQTLSSPALLSSDGAMQRKFSFAGQKTSLNSSISLLYKPKPIIGHLS